MGISVFISYSHADSDLFHVPEISQGLQKYPDIGYVFFSQRDVVDNFIGYMNQALGRVQAILLFCSEKSAQSRFVESEWTAAEAAKLPIIPVFLNPAFIPLLLRSRTGVLVQTNNLNATIAEIHDLLVKKTSEKQTPGAMPSQHLPVASTGGHIPGVITAPTPEAKESIIPSKCPKCGAALKKAGEKGPATCPFCKAKVA